MCYTYLALDWYMLVATLLLARNALTGFDLLLGAYVASLACVSVAAGQYTVRHPLVPRLLHWGGGSSMPAVI
jgi:hypothetical protein